MILDVLLCVLSILVILMISFLFYVSLRNYLREKNKDKKHVNLKEKINDYLWKKQHTFDAKDFKIIAIR